MTRIYINVIALLVYRIILDFDICKLEDVRLRIQNDLKSQKMEYLWKRFLYRTETLYSCYTHHKVTWYIHCDISMATQWALLSWYLCLFWVLSGFLTRSQPLSLHRLFSLQVHIPLDAVGKERDEETWNRTLLFSYNWTIISDICTHLLHKLF